MSTGTITVIVIIGLFLLIAFRWWLDYQKNKLKGGVKEDGK